MWQYSPNDVTHGHSQLRVAGTPADEDSRGKGRGHERHLQVNADHR